MLDPVTASRDRISEPGPGRWGGYADESIDEPRVVEGSGGAGRWLPWLVLLLIAVVVVAFLIGLPA